MDKKQIIKNFRIKGEPKECEKYGNGHINDTYLTVAELNGENYKYILQRVNHLIFPDIEKLMKNQELITAHIEKRLKELGNKDDRLILKIIYSLDNKSFVKAGKDFYRCYEFIEGGSCLEKITNPSDFELSGVAFGRFQKLLDGFEADKLYEVIPDFHNTLARFEQLVNAIRNDKQKRKEKCQEVIDEYLKRYDYADTIVKELARGKIPTRVTHNDTKLNNVLIDTKNHVPLAVLDLDTVMPGSIVYDFGDSIRFGANKGAEDERNLEKVGFDMGLFKAFTRGFMSEVKNILTEKERDYLAFGAILITYECGMRFLADYLNGDEYFKVSSENQNLDRARTQLKMVMDMEKELDNMQEYVWSFYE